MNDINLLGQRLCSVVLKTWKTLVIWSTSSVDKIVIDFLHQFYKHQGFTNQKFDLVWLSNYFCVSLISFSCWTQFDLVQFSSIQIQFSWVWLTVPGLLYTFYFKLLLVGVKRVYRCIKILSEPSSFDPDFVNLHPLPLRVQMEASGL